MFCLYCFVDLLAFVVTISSYLGFNLIKIQCFLCLMCLMCQCFNVSYKQDSVSPILFPHSRICLTWYYCIILHRDHKYFIKCFIEIFIVWFSKMKNDPRKWIYGNIMLYFVSQKIWWSHLYIFSSVPWMNYLINGRFAKVTSHWVWKKKIGIPYIAFR